MNNEFTLEQIRERFPCGEGWTKLLKNLGVNMVTCSLADLQRPLSLGDIAASNGAVDALWAVRCLDWGDAEVRRDVIAAVLPTVDRCMALLMPTLDDEPNIPDARWLRGAYCTLEQWCEGYEDADPARSTSNLWKMANHRKATTALTAEALARLCEATAPSRSAYSARLISAAFRLRDAGRIRMDESVFDELAEDLVKRFPPVWGRA